MKLGIDFGTTNSAIAALAPDGTAQIIPLTDDEPVQRSVIHAPLGVPWCSATMPSARTWNTSSDPLGSRRYGLPELIAAYLDFLLIYNGEGPCSGCPPIAASSTPGSPMRTVFTLRVWVAVDTTSPFTRTSADS